MKYDLFIQERGGTPRKVEDWSHFNDPIPNDGQPHGNSRRHGDASPAVQAYVIESIIRECVAQGLSKVDTAHVLAIARVESGFNPDAAAGQSSASGVGQFIERTGTAYGLSDKNRFDLKDNVRALVDHYQDNKELAVARGKDAAHIYKYHHDGPSLNSGGLGLARKEVLPYVEAYSASPVLANLTSWPELPMPENGRPMYDDLSRMASSAGGAPVGAEQGSRAAVPKSDSDLIRGLAVDALAQGLVPDAVRALVEHRYQGNPGEVAVQLAALNIAPSGPLDPAGPRMAASSELTPQGAASEPRGPVIPLSEALASHMAEKGFDAASIKQAPALALHVLEGAILKDTPAEALVLHKQGDALASLVGPDDARSFERAGDSVLALDKLESVAHRGLDTDAVASIRGLAPVQTERFSDLEVHQAASPELYSKALDPTATLNSAGAAQELIAALPSADRLSAPALQAQSEEKMARAEAQQTADMSMGA